MAGGNSASSGRTGVRVVVAGDRSTGKSSLIAAAATDSFPENVPHVLAPTRFPPDFFPDRVPITIIDTSARYASMHNHNLRMYIYDFFFLLRNQNMSI